MNLLLLEVDAYKFHREVSHPYFVRLAAKMDTEFKASFPSGLRLYHEADGTARETSCGVWLRSFLSTQNDSLRGALYTVPADGGHIPPLFREFNREENIDEDGLEVMEEKIVAGVSSKGSRKRKPARSLLDDSDDSNVSAAHGAQDSDSNSDGYDSEEERFFAAQTRRDFEQQEG